MDRKAYHNLFSAFSDAPLEELWKIITSDVSEDDIRSLVPVDVSFHRIMTGNVVSLEAFICISSADSDQWIWVRVERDMDTGNIREYFFTRDSYGKESLSSLQACIDYYKNEADFY